MVAENFIQEEYHEGTEGTENPEGPESLEGPEGALGIPSSYRFRFQPTLPPIPEADEDNVHTDESPLPPQTKPGL